MNLRRYIRNYFGFSKTETNGFIVLILLIILTFFSPQLIRSFTRDPSPNPIHLAKLDSLVRLMGDIRQIDEPEIEYFDFNPNTATIEQMQQLGLSDEIVTRIIKFRKRGNGFKTREDFKKIYGLTVQMYNALEPYIKIPERKIKNSSEFKRIVARNQSFKIDANVADSSQFKRIRGIGEVLSVRIVKFRDKLGGFYSVDQLKEVYGISEFALENAQKVLFISENFTPDVLSINSSSREELGSHPYIGYTNAKKIVAYRDQHGEFSDLTQLTSLDLIDREQFDRLSHYISL